MSERVNDQDLSPESKAFKYGLDVIDKTEPLIADYIRGELENQRTLHQEPPLCLNAPLICQIELPDIQGCPMLHRVWNYCPRLLGHSLLPIWLPEDPRSDSVARPCSALSPNPRVHFAPEIDLVWRLRRR